MQEGDKIIKKKKKKTKQNKLLLRFLWPKDSDNDSFNNKSY